MSDFTILSDRVQQLESALALAISRLDDPDVYTKGLAGGR